MEMDYGYIRDNLARVREACLARAAALGLPSPLLVAVTKSADNGEVRALVEQFGQSAIAENRTALFNERYELFDEAHRPEMHLIGSLQTNKVKTVVGRVALIHSVDSERLAAEIDKRAAAAGIRQRVLLEINSGREENKGGVLPEAAEAMAERLASFPHLSLRGVMTMAPNLPSPEEYRPYFRETAALLARLRDTGMIEGEGVLSMGMSDSYEVAIEEGATLVRVGRTLFRHE